MEEKKPIQIKIAVKNSSSTTAVELNHHKKQQIESIRGDNTITREKSRKEDFTDYLDGDLSNNSSCLMTTSSRGIADHSSQIYGLDNLFSNTKKKRVEPTAANLNDYNPVNQKTGCHQTQKVAKLITMSDEDIQVKVSNYNQLVMS